MMENIEATLVGNKCTIYKKTLILASPRSIFMLGEAFDVYV